ncbi:SGNH/GDSL hydrolase family protein [Phytoactinopolyspora limicola]|uniref:SGNH/GDSL hydrolase family protein n=1 Tax=Phytoactinopolyspora limicola TaxID=2715536 RepID=UPI00140BDCFE|nr:SGNH/GDSL hydrolase family protein [Phytoactinopolyspora limicola]
MARSFSLDPGRRPWAWMGMAEWCEEDGAAQPWRINRDLAMTSASAEFVAGAREPCGVRARVFTDARRLELVTRRTNRPGGVCDVLVDDVLVYRWRAGVGDSRMACDLPGRGMRTVEVWLPQQGQAALVEIALHDASQVQAAPAADLSWVTYGSSITQCAAAEGPSETWPALIARQHDWQLRSLGLGGQCHLDTAAARTIRDEPADLISLCLGINIYGQCTFNARSLPSAVTGFIQTVRDGHPKTPIVVISPISSPLREAQANGVGMTLQDVRGVVHGAVDLLINCGDTGLYPVDGRDVLADGEAGLLFDGVHPRAEGYRLMAERLAPLLASVIAT